MRTDTSATHCTLLHSGADYFPALLAAIDAAQQSIVLETYIFADDATGHSVRDALLAAAARGVAVRVTVDGFGSGAYARVLVAQLGAAGVVARIYRPQRWWQAGLSPALLRRLHRKVCVIDAALADSSPTGTASRCAFVGGINILDDHNHYPHTDPTLGARFDYAVRLRGAVVADVARLCDPLASTNKESILALWRKPVALFQRDNLRHRNSIQKLYLKLLASAQREVWIANAYFMPGRRFRRALVSCAQRGVQVNLLLQGHQEYLLQHHATRALYGQMLAAGVRIFEYQASFLHAKVAVVDSARATVGSSNIDPFSLLLAREANVSVNQPAFATELRAALLDASTQHAIEVMPQTRPALWRRGLDWVAYGLLRLGVMVAVGRY